MEPNPDDVRSEYNFRTMRGVVRGKYAARCFMAKSEPIPDDMRKRVEAAVAAAWESGCPVAGSQTEAQARNADNFLRRFGSFARRGVDGDDPDAIIRDLARGLAEVHEPNLKLVGPLMRDYEWLAEQVLLAMS